MCGITGFWSTRLARDDARSLIDAMNRTVRHRGPDGEGTWLHPRTGAVLGHRRLAIIDLSENGHQPMVSASGRYTITFNGEVYNFRELREELETARLAPAWRGTSDTEVMLAAIEAWGVREALVRFVGMFAFALWDEDEHAVVLARDRLGVKPLYYEQTGHGLCFGSELKSLRLFPGFRTTIDRGSLAGYLRANCVPGERTIFEGARRVGPGTFLVFREPDSAAVQSHYWDAAQVALDGLASPFPGTEQEALDELDRHLRQAVRMRMVADVPLGAFLSGGIDSSTVVAMMQAESERPVHTFSIQNEPEAFDEGDAARAVARHLNSHHTAVTVTAADALDIIPMLPSMYDEPFADSSQIPTYLVSRLARRDVTVALSGDGGDEMFGGYVRHVWAPTVWALQRRIPLPLRHRAARWISGHSAEEWDRAFRRAAPIVPPTRIAGIRMHKLASILGASSPAAMYDTLATHWNRADNVLLDPADPPGDGGPPPPTAIQADPTSYMIFRDLTGYLPNDVLTKLDRASMAVSLEAREPLLDHRLHAFAWSLPARLKVRGQTGKWALRQVLHRYVPKSLVSGPKTGFGVPLGEWLRGPLRGWAEDLLSERSLKSTGCFDVAVVRSRWEEHLAGRRPQEYHLWDILMFQAWSTVAS